MMGTTMDNPTCEWIRGRLPLGLGSGEGLDRPGGEGDDLGSDEHRAIGRHLAGCPGCRRHRSELADALGALAVAAGTVPVRPDTPSLWPALQRRIAALPTGGVPVEDGADPADGPAPPWTSLDDDRPLRSAWMQDTLSEVAESAGLVSWPERWPERWAGLPRSDPGGSSG